jgi:hypothetical protein
MSRRIEIELTSKTPDGAWTWRAAGARQPKGTFGSSLAPPDAAVGTVYRAEVESGLDGVEVVALLPVKGASQLDTANRIEVVGSPRRAPEVSVTLVRDSRRGRDGERGERGERREGRSDRGRPRGPRPEGDRGAGGDRGPRRSERGPRRDRGGEDRATDATGRQRRTPAMSTVHRNAALATLRPEQLPVAEQLLRGGIPAVRQAITEQNAAARSSGAPPVSAEALLAIAEELLPLTKLAEWKDRATTAVAQGRELRLRDLRAVVAASRTVNLDEEGRALAKTLNDSLDARVTALREEWINRIKSAVSDGRVLEALRVSTRAPEPGTRCPAELAVALTDAAGTAMTAETDTVEWQALLEAVIDSPVRRTVKPQGIPADEGAQAAARHAAGAVPELAKLLGLRIPPPPPRRTVIRRTLTPSGDPGRGSASAS